MRVSTAGSLACCARACVRACVRACACACACGNVGHMRARGCVTVCGCHQCLAPPEHPTLHAPSNPFAAPYKNIALRARTYAIALNVSPSKVARGVRKE